jgi:hypothetical protein
MDRNFIKKQLYNAILSSFVTYAPEFDSYPIKPLSLHDFLEFAVSDDNVDYDIKEIKENREEFERLRPELLLEIEEGLKMAFKVDAALHLNKSPDTELLMSKSQQFLHTMACVFQEKVQNNPGFFISDPPTN